MVKQRIQLKRKAPITRRIKTRDRPPRFQQNANQKTVVKVYNSFEKMRKRLPRKKAQNYRYRDTSRAPSFQSVKEANGNISSLGYTPASSNLIHLSNMQKLIEDKVINEIKMISSTNKPNAPEPVVKMITLPLGEVPKDMFDYFKSKSSSIPLLQKVKNYCLENSIAFKPNDTKAMLMARIALDTNSLNEQDWNGLLSNVRDDSKHIPREPQGIHQKPDVSIIEPTPPAKEKPKRSVSASRVRRLAPVLEEVKDNAIQMPSGMTFMTPEMSDSEIKKMIEEGGKYVYIDPKGSGTGIKPLYGSQIDLMMKDYRKRGYVGVFCIDEISTLLSKAIKGMDRWSCVINTLRTTDSENATGHWTALYCDKVNEKVLEFYDSLAYPVSDEMLKELKPVIDSMDLPYMLKFKHNTIRNQRANSSTCGFLAVNYLMNRYDGISFKECSGFDNLEDQAKKLAQRFKYI